MIGEDLLFSFIMFFIAAIVGKVVSEGALRRLNPEEKARLLDAFSNYRIYSLGLVLGLVVLYMAGTRFYPHLHDEITWLYFLCLGVAIVATGVLNVRKMKGLHLPAGYIKQYIISMGVQYIGIGFLLAPLAKAFR